MYEFLKKLFGNTEDGQPKAMTYDELEAAIKADSKLKIVNIADGGYVAKEKFDAKTTELDGVKQQLEDASKEIKSYKEMDVDGIKAKAQEWETKYNTDTQALNEKLTAQERTHQTDMFLAGYKFTSKAAEKGIRAEFESKEFKLDNGQFLGASDYMKSLMENEDYKGAFVVEDSGDNGGDPGAGGSGNNQNNGGNQVPPPQFAAGTNGGGNAGGAGAGGNNPFSAFSFTPVRPRPEGK